MNRRRRRVRGDREEVINERKWEKKRVMEDRVKAVKEEGDKEEE